MKKIIQISLALTVLSLTLRAEEPKPLDLSKATLPQVWALVQESTKMIQTAVETKNYGPFHPADAQLASALPALGEKATMVTGEKKKALETSLLKTKALAHEIHKDGHTGNTSGMLSAYADFQKELKVVEAQFPPGILTPN
jgi:hypothetical protein